MHQTLQSGTLRVRSPSQENHRVNCHIWHLGLHTRALRNSPATYSCVHTTPTSQFLEHWGHQAGCQERVIRDATVASDPPPTLRFRRTRCGGGGREPRRRRCPRSCIGRQRPPLVSHCRQVFERHQVAVAELQPVPSRFESAVKGFGYVNFKQESAVSHSRLFHSTLVLHLGYVRAHAYKRYRMNMFKPRASVRCIS